MTISIFGLGYVGTVTLGCLARKGHRVIGVDIDQTKLDAISKGRSPVVEEGMEQLLMEASKCGRVSVTKDVEYAIHNSELSFVCVGTPSLPNGDQDLSTIKRLTKQIATALNAKSDYHVIVVRSTILPGTLENVIRPIIESNSLKKCNLDFDLCFMPEFLREGSSIEDFYNPPFTVVGSDSEKAIGGVKKLFADLPCEFISTTPETAEMLKYCCNAFHAAKVTFANEIGRISHSLGINPHLVMDLVCRDKNLNISRAYLKPGFAFGGSCLPKDLKALTYLAKHKDVSVPLLAAIQRSNRAHIDRAIEMVLESGKKHVSMLGLSFKSGTDDLRESPLVSLAEQFIGKGLSLKIYDPEVNMSRLIGTNRAAIENAIPHIASLMCDRVDDLVTKSETEILIIGLGDRTLNERLHALSDNPGPMILDLVGVPEIYRGRVGYRGICW